MSISELPSHVPVQAVGSFPLPWRRTHRCSISTVSGVTMWSFPICKFILDFVICLLKLQYINMTSWPGHLFLSCSLKAAAVVPKAELHSHAVRSSWRPSELKQSLRSEMGLVLSDSPRSDWEGNTALLFAALLPQQVVEVRAAYLVLTKKLKILHRCCSFCIWFWDATLWCAVSGLKEDQSMQKHSNSLLRPVTMEATQSMRVCFYFKMIHVLW